MFQFNDVDNKDIIVIGVIISKVSNNSYQIKDSKGRQFNVNADKGFRIGDTVITKQGIILGKSKSLGSFKEFNV